MILTNSLLMSHLGSKVRVIDEEWRQYVVEFTLEWKCLCGDWQDTLLPCKHAWQAITKLKKWHHSFVSPFYSHKMFQVDICCSHSSNPL